MRIKLHASYFTPSRLDFKEVVHHALWIYSIYVLFNTKRIVFVTSNAHLFWHTSCKTMPLSWWSIIANYSLPRRLRPKEDAWHVFGHRRSQDPGIPKLANVLFVYMYLYLCSVRFCFVIVFVLPFCNLTHILPEMLQRPRDSQISWCFVCLFICICICVLCVIVLLSYLYFPYCIWHIFYQRWLQDLGIPKLVHVFLFTCICTCVLRIFVFLSYLYFVLTHILPELVPISRDSQIGCCLLPEAPHKQ